MIFDPTVSLGSVFASISIILSLVAVAWRNGLKLQQGLDRLERLESQVNLMDTKVQHIAVLQQQLIDGKERMDGFDERLRELERVRRA